MRFWYKLSLMPLKRCFVIFIYNRVVLYNIFIKNYVLGMNSTYHQKNNNVHATGFLYLSDCSPQQYDTHWDQRNKWPFWTWTTKASKVFTVASSVESSAHTSFMFSPMLRCSQVNFSPMYLHLWSISYHKAIHITTSILLIISNYIEMTH
jgi:hypothetical protein